MMNFLRLKILFILHLRSPIIFQAIWQFNRIWKELSFNWLILCPQVNGLSWLYIYINNFVKVFFFMRVFFLLYTDQLNKSILPIDGKVIGTTTPGQSEPGSNGKLIIILFQLVISMYKSFVCFIVQYNWY